MMCRNRQEDPVDRLYRFLNGIGADMLRRIGRLERRKREAEIDAFLRP
jgi:hypothetical protein